MCVCAVIEGRVRIAGESEGNREENMDFQTAPRHHLWYDEQLKCVLYRLDKLWKKTAGRTLTY